MKLQTNFLTISTFLSEKKIKKSLDFAQNFHSRDRHYDYSYPILQVEHTIVFYYRIEYKPIFFILIK